MTISPKTLVRATFMCIALAAAVLVPALAAGQAGHAALMGDDVFFTMAGEPFLVPLTALRYPSALRAPISQFYFDAPLTGVAGPFVALDSVRCHFSSARDDLAAPAQADDGIIVHHGPHGVRTTIHCSASLASHADIAYCTHVVHYVSGHPTQLRLRYPRDYLGAWREIQSQVEAYLQLLRLRGRQAMAGIGAGDVR